MFLYFLLVSGDSFLRRLVEVLPRFASKRQAVDISQQIGRDISAYLVTITLMNALVGAATALVMWSTGVGDPVLWGTVAFILNYVPLLGPAAAFVIFLFAGSLTITSTWQALLPAALYVVIHVIEGETVTPMLLARRFTLNPVLVIFSFVFWFWLWGVPGAMGELRDPGLGLAADALAKSAEHIGAFFKMLQTELGFYIGCLNLHQRLLELGAPFTFPSATGPGAPRFSCRDLYEVCLALTANRRPVGNDINADGKSLIIVTGANQGGKTTFLRSFGLAQLMSQSGMFAPAASLELNVVDGVFTHFKHEEDATMKSGKFDEELSRMNDTANVVTPNALMLFNELFAATNEREGSEIARQIVSALLEKPIKVVFVSHQYDFAHGFYEKQLDAALFLRADRQEDGRRTFKLIESEPLGTSFGEDVYREIFSNGKAPAADEATSVVKPRLRA